VGRRILRIAQKGLIVSSNQDIKPASVDVPESVLNELQARLANTRWTDELPADPADADEAGLLPPDWGYGVSRSHVQRLVEYWHTGYNWREWEARLNSYPQFTTEIDGATVHFLHVRSPEPDALPLILTHGWPGSVMEYLDVIEPLTDPRKHGGGPNLAFDVVIPCIPGFGFSGPTRQRAWNRYRIAAAWVELMSRLGYQKYGAAGNDAGSMISPEVGRLDPDHVVGVHVTQIFSFPSGDPAELADLTPDEAMGLARLQWFWEKLGAFNQLHSQQPQTLAHALADSPAGLLGWMSQLFGDVDDDFILTNVMTYWLTGTAGSSIRLYFEDARATHPTEPTTVPLGLAMGGGDFISIRRFAERDHKNIASWNNYPTGSHWQAHLTPDQLVDDIRRFYRSL
jgi:epoxide hydrolase